MSDADENAGHPSLAERAIDLLVYAPAGVVASIIDEFPDLVERGRSQIEPQVRSAHALGQFAVTFGRKDLAARLHSLSDGVMDRFGSSRSPSPPIPSSRGAVPTTPAPSPRPTAMPSGPSPAAIPEYDTLSASQVVRRLDGLGADELLTVVRYESTGRNRRTILHRADALLTGTAGVDPLSDAR